MRGLAAERHGSEVGRVRFEEQAFRRDLLLRALKAAQADGVVATDEAMAVERLGLHPALVEGREDNLKVTTPADLALAEFLLGHASR